MAISYRGKKVDMVSLAKKNEKAIALGNAHMNGRGDVVGKGGKIEKTREEVLADWYATHTTIKEVANLKESDEETNEDITEPSIEKVKPQKISPKYEDITEEEKVKLKKVK